MNITDLQIEEQLNQLLELHPKRIDLSLDRIQSLLAKLENPQDKIKNIIHIAGTNGKFSTLKFIQVILQAMDKVTNAYISPHLVRFNERFELFAQEISLMKEQLLKLQSYTMDVNKVLYEERIHVLTNNNNNAIIINDTHSINESIDAETLTHTERLQSVIDVSNTSNI